ncbi:hypothetical protein J1N35_011071 [Gossypium stocksii]|uniref:Uncharacterized protein n=1 Tax=Gossypium stocksii TaxID=47602 RepID=A0A9D3W2U6_9ROSI|nr:hypothetical protein J1N35_011071 [Gossypium stocksii]
MDIKVILGKSRTTKSASIVPSKKPVTKKYRKRSRENVDAPIAKESEPPQPKWRSSRKDFQIQRDTENKCKLLESKVESLEKGESSLREQLQSQKLYYGAKLDSLLQSNDEAFKK